METDSYRIKNFDFFGEGETEFYDKFSIESVLIQGKHRETAPMVTVILPTYKRPDLLKQSLESALNQVEFDDYQILIVDNEGADIEKETETAKLISHYQDEKIIYYRHRESVNFKMDYAVRLARSKWICFLHDDDILASNHLISMSKIIKEHRNIKFLSSTFKHFFNTISDNEFATMTAPHKVLYQIKKYPKSYTCVGYFPSWVGAFIDRKAYISIGGMPTLHVGIGDYCMVGKFIYKYGTYEVKSSVPLYFIRRWSGQVTASGTEMWRQAYINEYNYHIYVTRKYHKIFCDFWNRISAYRILEKCESLNRSYYHTAIDLDNFVQECNMQSDILEKGKLYKRDVIWQTLYEQCIEKFCFPIKYKGEI